MTADDDKCFCGAEWIDEREECAAGHAFGEADMYRVRAEKAEARVAELQTSMSKAEAFADACVTAYDEHAPLSGDDYLMPAPAMHAWRAAVVAWVSASEVKLLPACSTCGAAEGVPCTVVGQVHASVCPGRGVRSSDARFKCSACKRSLKSGEFQEWQCPCGGLVTERCDACGGWPTDVRWRGREGALCDSCFATKAAPRPNEASGTGACDATFTVKMTSGTAPYTYICNLRDGHRGMHETTEGVAFRNTQRSNDAKPAPRCSVCGASRIVREDGRVGACSLVPGRDGKGGCPDPLRDCRAEQRTNDAAGTPDLARARIECRRAFDAETAIGMLAHLERANALLDGHRSDNAVSDGRPVATAQEEHDALIEIGNIVMNDGLDHEWNPKAIVEAVRFLSDQKDPDCRPPCPTCDSRVDYPRDAVTSAIAIAYDILELVDYSRRGFHDSTVWEDEAYVGDWGDNIAKRWREIRERLRKASSDTRSAKASAT